MFASITYNITKMVFLLFLINHEIYLFLPQIDDIYSPLKAPQKRPKTNFWHPPLQKPRFARKHHMSGFYRGPKSGKRGPPPMVLAKIWYLVFNFDTFFSATPLVFSKNDENQEMWRFRAFSKLLPISTFFEPPILRVSLNRFKLAKNHYFYLKSTKIH